MISLSIPKKCLLIWQDIFDLGTLALCLRIAPLFHNFRNSANIRNSLIYCVNRYLLMFGGSQGQIPYHASMNGILTF